MDRDSPCSARRIVDSARRLVELARRFGIMSIPTVVFLKNGKEIERKVGVLPPETFAAVLEQYL